MKIDPQSKKPQLHVSALNTLSFCGEQFRRRYVENEKKPPGIALVVGRAVDTAVTADMNEKKRSRQLLPDEAIGDIARDSVVEEIAKDGLRAESPEEQASTLDKIAGDGIDRSVRMALTHHIHHAPKLNPKHVQRPFVITLKDFPFDLAGTWDLETEDRPRDDRERLLAESNPIVDIFSAIRDTKAKKASPPMSLADDDDQLTMYAFAKRILDGKLPGRVTLDCIVDTKTPKVVALESTRTLDDLPPFVERLKVAARAITSGVFVPAKQTDFMCSPRYCGFFDTCRYVKKPKSITVPAETYGGADDSLVKALKASIEMVRGKRTS